MTYHCLEHWNDVLLPVLFYGIPVFFQFVLSWHCILVLTFLSCWAAVQDLGAQRWAYHQRNGMNTPLDLCLAEAICMASVGQHGLWSSTTFHDPGVSVWVEEMEIAWNAIHQNRKSAIFIGLTNLLTHWGWDKMAATPQTAFSNTFSSMKMLFWMKFQWKVCSWMSNW